MTPVRYDLGGLEVTHTDQVLTITLCRPDVLNAQTPHTWEALRQIADSTTPDVRIVVVRGAGRAFSAGLDRRMFTTHGVPGTTTMTDLACLPVAEADAIIAGYQQGFTWLRRPDIVSVAAVQGHAIGAGLQLALACDVRILAADAMLCMAETTLGLVPDLGGTKALVSLVGPSRALEMCLTGRRVTAEQAMSMGLASLTVPLTELDQAVDDFVAAVLASPHGAVVETKALMHAAASRTAADQEAAERAAQLRRIHELAGGPQ